MLMFHFVLLFDLLCILSVVDGVLVWLWTFEDWGYTSIIEGIHFKIWLFVPHTYNVVTLAIGCQGDNKLEEL